MSEELACEALRQGKRLELRYDGWTRNVEIHSVGTTSIGTPIMSVWQVRGGSNSDESAGWKQLRIDETFSPRMIDEKSEAPRTGYKRNHKAMVFIRCQI